MREAHRIESLHRMAMELAGRAEASRDPGRAHQLFREAFEKEREAAELLDDQTELEPTRSVLFRSAASLAVDCKDFTEAERLLAKGLAGSPPADVAEEMLSLRRSLPASRIKSSVGGRRAV